MRNRYKKKKEAAVRRVAKFPFDFSLVISVYNVEEYIREALESIVSQTHPFSKVQLVLVDDGSTDSSGQICDEYSQRYPDNVMVIHKENGGQASARMVGIPCAQGKYVNFFDPDDILTPGTLQRVFEFMENHIGEIDVGCIPLIFFGEKNGPHPLNGKFAKGCRVIDLKEEYTGVAMSCASSFFTNEAAQSMDFDSALVTAEDAKELMKIMLRKQKIGVICGSEIKYLYRKYRTSTVGSAQEKKGWYIDYLDHFSQWAMDYSKEKLGYIPRFVQYTVLYDLQWKYMKPHIPDNVLSEEEIEIYQEKLFALASYIDDDIIMNAKHMYRDQKLYLLYRKYGRSPQIFRFLDEKETAAGRFGYNDVLLGTFSSTQTALNFLEIENEKIIIQGSQFVSMIGMGDPEIYAVANMQDYKVSPVNYENIVYSADVPVACRKEFRVEIPINNRTRVRVKFKTVFENLVVDQRVFTFGKHSPINYKVQNSYYYKDGYMMRPTKDGFYIEKTTPVGAAKQELRLYRELIKKHKTDGLRTAICRFVVQVLRKMGPKNIWLIADKANRGDDNGEAFFRYLVEHQKEAGCRPVFAVSKDSPDYERIGKIGPVVPYMSTKHKLLHLLAEHTISAYSHDEISSPFLQASYLYADLLQRNKVVFLQHGITKDDVSVNLNKNHKNFALFVTSVRPEWKSIVKGNYGYNEEQIILTGFPRYDYLYENTQKIITIMPTWLRSLFGAYDSATSQWELLPGFEESAYYQFYNGLMTSQRLLDTADQLGYRIQFLPHPVLFPYADRFTPDARVKVLDSNVRYRDVYAESALVTTDYSSAVFDFVYLKKPVIYTQFEENHYEEGYFSYERDGFGEIEHDLESTIDRIIEYMQNGCAMKPMYIERVEKFFTFHDRNNSQRVLEKIKEFDRRSNVIE